MNKSKEIIEFGNKMAYLSFANAAVVTSSSSKEMFAKADADPVKKKAKDDKEYSVVPWGADNDLPIQIINKAGKSHDISSSMLFNIQLGYGSGIMPAKVQAETTGSGEIKLSYTPVLDNKEINLFLENNDIDGFLLQQITDLNFFYNVFPSILLNREKPESRKIVELRHRDASFCRWTEMNEAGQIEHCLYSPLWADGTQQAKDIIPIPVLDSHNPTLDLRRKMGAEIYPDGKKKDDQFYEYIVPVSFPTPGRSYYNKPYWYSLIESGWYDFALLIPEFKKALLQNQMLIKYVVYIEEDYFKRIFAEEGIKTDPDKKARVTKEYQNIQNFLSGTKKAGKATVGKIRYTPDGKERKDIIIQPVEHTFKGGEYIEDSEEVSTILAYGMGTHGSLIGSHGKSKTINGTEARELFIIKQAIMKPIRDRILRPLNLIRAINKWPDDIRFIIPNLLLTTLDSGTGSKKVIS